MRHLLRQGRPAIDTEEVRCCYRLQVGDKVLSCAVGGLIPDDKYQLVWDVARQGSHTVFRDLGIDDYPLKFAASLMQRVHDRWALGDDGVGMPLKRALLALNEDFPRWRYALEPKEVEDFLALVTSPPTI